MSALRRSLVLASALLGCALEYTVPLAGESLVCDADQVACGDRCVALDDDADHCGACEHACALGESCMAGECIDACGDQDACGSACVDFTADPANCGACDRWCDNEESCEAGACVRRCTGSCEDEDVCVDGECVCRDGFAVCNGDCVDLQTDDANCGECDRQCDGQPCGGGECQDDTCTGFADHCDHACTDVQVDPLNCGACDHACHPSQRCIAGACVSPG